MSSFDLSNIEKSYGANKVIRDISLSFHSGTVTALVGDNGAGKSTFLKIMAGILTPDAGKVILDDIRVDSTSSQEHRLRGIEMVYQDLALAKQHDVTTNLFLGRERCSRFGFLQRRKMIESAKESLLQIGVEIKDINSPVRALSGGQQQAVAIARALIFDPRVLLLDEPTAALAEREVQRLLAMINRQRDQGRIIVLVSHRLNDVFAVSDRIVVMRRGRIVADQASSATSMSEVVERIVG